MAEMKQTDAYRTGEATRRSVLGDTHVDRSIGNATDFDAEFIQYITEIAWAGVWSRPGLDKRTRSLVTIAILAALGRGELLTHLKGSQNTGCTLDEIKEVMLHVAVYGGVPAAVHAMGVAKAALTTNQ